MLDGSWTDPQEFISTGVAQGGSVTETYTFTSDPTSVRLQSDDQSSDWGFWSVELACDSCSPQTLRQNPNGEPGATKPPHERDTDKAEYAGWGDWWVGPGAEELTGGVAVQEFPIGKSIQVFMDQCLHMYPVVTTLFSSKMALPE